MIFAGGTGENDLSFFMCGVSYRIEDKHELDKILAGLPHEKHKQHIFVGVWGLGAVKEARAFVVIKGKKVEAVKDDFFLKFEVPKAGKYKIQIKLPYRTRLEDNDGSRLKEILYSDKQSIFETEMEVGADECVYRKFIADDPPKTSKINYFTNFTDFPSFSAAALFYRPSNMP